MRRAVPSPRLRLRLRLTISICLFVSATVVASMPPGTIAKSSVGRLASRIAGASRVAFGGSPPPPPSITAAKTATLLTDVDGDGKADPGDVIRYRATITNSGDTPATGVRFLDTPDPHTTWNGTTFHLSPLAVNESYASTGNMTLDSSTIAANCGANSLFSVTCNDTFNSGTLTTFGNSQANAGNTAVNGINTVTTTNGGTVTLNTDGSFVYNPAAGFEGTDTFWYTLTNAAITPSLTDVAQVSITVGGVTGGINQMVWFVNSTGAAGTGTQASPFNSLSAFRAVNNGTATNPAAGDTIYLFENGTPYTGGVTLLANQRLIGQDATAGPSSLNGPSTQPGNAYPATNPSGALVSVTSSAAATPALTLGSGNTIAGFIAGHTGGGFAISGGAAGSLSVREVIVSSAGGGGINIATSAAIVSNPTFTGFTSVTTTGGTNGVALTGVTGALALGTGTLSGASGATFGVSGGTATIAYGGTISQGNNAAVVSISGGHVAGVITFGGAVSATNGPGLQFDNADGTYTFNSAVTLNGGDAGIDILNGASGAFSFPAGSAITNPSGVAFNVSGATASNATVTWNGNISKTSAGAIVNIDNHDAGTITFQNGTFSATSSATGIVVSNSNGGAINFNQATKTLTTGSNVAVALNTSNGGGTINFGGGGLAITTTTANGFSATGGGTVTVTGSGNTISASTGTPLTVTNTTIGASGLTFQSLASAGAVSGIVLSSTGPGNLTVTGNSSGACGGTVTASGATVTAPVTADCTGGAILNSTGPGVNLSTVGGSVSLTRVRIANGADDGIRVSSVNGLTLTSCLLETNGNAVGERGLDALNLTGSGGISASSIKGSAEQNVIINNTTGTLSPFNVSNSQIGVTNFTTGDDGVLLLIDGAAVITSSVTQSAFTDNKGDHFQAATTASTTGTINITFSNNTLLTTAANDANVIGGGITINPGNSGHINFTVSGNNIQEAFDDGINLNLDPSSTSSGSLIGTISGNTIGAQGVANSGSESSNTITAAAKGAGTMTVAIVNNSIHGWTNAFGIFLGNTEGSATANFTVTGNTVTPGDAVLGLNAIQASAGATSGPPADNGTMCLGLSGNTVTGSGVAGSTDIRLRQRFSTGIKLPGYAGAANNTTAVNAFVSAANNSAPSVSSIENTAGGGGGYTGGAACAMPGTTPTASLRRASEEFVVAAASLQPVGSLISRVGRRAASAVSLATAAAQERAVSAVAQMSGLMTRFDGRQFVPSRGALVSGLRLALTAGRHLLGVWSAELLASGPALDVTVGTLPVGESMTVVFDVTVDSPPVALYSNQATVTGDNFTSTNTNTATTDGDRYNTTTALASSKTPADQGESITFTATVTPTEGSGLTPGGTVQFKDNGVNLGTTVTCTAAAGNTCTAQLVTSSLTPATHPITAEYLGGTNHDASTSNTVSQVVIACSANPIVTVNSDTGPGSLRQAIADVCPTAGNNTITFDMGTVTSPIGLTSGEL